jgi:uncharacterized protein involved in copper resistance
VVTIFQDFSFTSPDDLMAGIEHEPGHGGMDHGAMGGQGMDHGAMSGMSGMQGMEMDLNDIDFDAYLANDRTLSDPEVVRVERGGRLDWQPVRDAIRAHGMRNSNVLAIAPTATISNICDVSQSIEPTYKNLFVKSNLSGEFLNKCRCFLI